MDTGYYWLLGNRTNALNTRLENGDHDIRSLDMLPNYLTNTQETTYGPEHISKKYKAVSSEIREECLQM